jgi:hypothetical protein
MRDIDLLARATLVRLYILLSIIHFFVDWGWQLEFSMSEARSIITQVRRGRMLSLSAMTMSIGGAMSPRCRSTPATRVDGCGVDPLESMSGYTTRKRLLSTSSSVLFLICRRISRCVVWFIKILLRSWSWSWFEEKK